MATRMQQRRGSSSDWAAANPVLAAGELGVTTDTGIIKIGDGVTVWNNLPTAFGSSYLPLLGKAADADKLDGLDSTQFVKKTETSTAGTANTYVLRDASGNSAFNEATVAAQTTAASATRKDYVDTGDANSRRTVTSLLSSTAYTLAAANEGALLFYTGTTPATWTIPANASVAIPVGAFFDISQNNTGALTVSAAAGVTVVYQGRTTNAFVLPGQYSTVRYVKTATDSWYAYLLSGTDTGWTSLALPTGAGYTVSQGASIPFAVRRVNDRCFIRGELSGTWPANAVFATLAAEYRPAAPWWFHAVVYGNGYSPMQINSNGQVIFALAANNNGALFSSSWITG